MTIGERIKKLRKDQGLTLDKFGERLGVSKVAISLLENGKNGLTDQMALSICREFGAREEWLRTGNGEMYEQTQDSLLGDLVLQYGLDDFDQRIIIEYMKLDKQSRDVFKDYLMRVTAVSEDDSDEDSIDEQVEEYRRQLLAEGGQADGLSVSGDFETKKA